MICMQIPQLMSAAVTGFQPWKWHWLQWLNHVCLSQIGSALIWTKLLYQLPSLFQPKIIEWHMKLHCPRKKLNLNERQQGQLLLVTLTLLHPQPLPQMCMQKHGVFNIYRWVCVCVCVCVWYIYIYIYIYILIDL